ncbi:MAG: GGDEF domain-containing protein, partial [Desulfovibrionaceae bacterium]|nr:GGDEF domain-containing protein [Desulfovibrionaceae bacterium]
MDGNDRSPKPGAPRPPYMERLCAIMDKFGISDNEDWIAVVLFARNLLKALACFTEDQKNNLRQYVFREVSRDNLSDKRLAAVLQRLEEFILSNKKTGELEVRLREEKRSSAAMINEIMSVLVEVRQNSSKRESDLNRFGEQTVAVVQSDAERSEMINSIRGMVEKLVEEAREEARYWESRARAMELCAVYDPLLTELRNRRALDANLAVGLKRAQAEGRPVSVMMIDLDHFKRVNDTFGHQVGDDVLKAVSKIVAAQTSNFGGFAARYGGEEIVVVCEGLALEEAVDQAEAMRA